MARNDLMTALLDTRRALEEQVTALGERVDISRREVAETVTSQVSDLHADNRETRNRVNNASASLSEINKSLPALRQELADLSRTVNDLRTTVNDLFTRLPDAPAASLPSSPGTDSTAPDQPPASERDQAAPAGIDSSPGPGPTALADNEAAESSDTPVAAPDRQEAGSGDESEGVAQRQAAADAVSNTQADAEEGPASGPPAPHAGADPSTKGSELAQHDLILSSAATVGTVDLVCHRDLWDFIQEHAADIAHFSAPAAPNEEGHDRLRITLSGRSVIGVLIAMRDIRRKNAAYGKDDGTWSLSGAVYRRLAEDLKTTSRSGTRPLTVVFDDGLSDAPDTPMA